MLPEAFLENMKKLLGEDFNDFLASFDKEKNQGLRVNLLKGTVEEFLSKGVFTLSPVTWAKSGFYYGSKDQPGKHPYHEAGVYYIQEPSAMLSAALLSPEPGDKVLDLCAAPGGKTTQIAAALDGQGILVSNEIHPQRARILSENVERMGIKNCIVTNESPDKLCNFFVESFDKIMVDAPCSGEGMFRKNEQACQEWSMENVNICAERQDQILDCAAKMVRKGGKIVYSTCTFEPIEDEGAIERFLQRHPDFCCLKIERIWPHTHQGEGHFAALLQREGEEEGFFEHELSQMSNKELKELQDYFSFIKGNLTVELKGILTCFGDQLYLAPEHSPELRGIKVLRPGLHLGTLKKNRFEPSHALALALRGEQIKHKVNFPAEDDRIKAYLNGMTIDVSDLEPLVKGWYVIQVDGYGVGWGKYAGQIMKNHYPKGLRIILRG